MRTDLSYFKIVLISVVVGLLFAYAGQAQEPIAYVPRPSLLEPQVVRPQWPKGAREAGKQGAVRTEVVIETDGRVEQVTLRRCPSGVAMKDADRCCVSDSVFEQAAVDYVRGYRFEPTLFNGMPVRIAMIVDVGFNIGSALNATCSWDRDRVMRATVLAP
jgi:hypothetical protein